MNIGYKCDNLNFEIVENCRGKWCIAKFSDHNLKINDTNFFDKMSLTIPKDFRPANIKLF